MSPHDAHARTELVELDPCASATSTKLGAGDILTSKLDGVVAFKNF